MKKMKLVCLVLCVLTVLSSTAIAEGITPYSDNVFISWSAILTDTKVGDFSAVTYDNYNEIKVSKCVLEQKVNGRWVNKGELPKPSGMKNTFVFSGACDYASYLSDGCTYRLKVTFWADGYEMTRTSSEKSY